MPHNQAFVDWFRQASPYIHAHRGRTFVVTFGGEAVADPGFPNLVHDLAILQGLGIGLLPAFLADEYISAGRLVPILPEEPLRDGEVHAVWPRSVAPSPAVTALIRHLTTRPSPVSNSAQKILD